MAKHQTDYRGINIMLSNVGLIKAADAITKKPVPVESSSGALPFTDGKGGQLSNYILSPKNADVTDIDAERVIDIAGVSRFRLTVFAGDTSSVTAFIIGYSTTVNDLTAVNAAMATAATEVGTPAGTQLDNVIIIPTHLAFAANSGLIQSDWFNFNDETIKTIAVRSVGADYATGVILETVK